ncbi:MAG TPA: SPFH domain-containing protein, partial [Bacteroidota bacterium]|nr:SPFH domain-containing protein [Bacteroidota bacterium]
MVESTIAVSYIVWAFGIIGFLIVLFSSFFTVKEQTNAVIERFGKFKRIATPGLGMKLPLIDKIAGRPSLKVRQLDVKVETKTEDNVFVTMIVPVQFYIIPAKVQEAFYKLADPEQQIESFVFDVVRARVPEMKLDEVFQKKDQIADAVKKELSDTMDDYGYSISKALVTDIDPDAKVKTAMNEINAAQRERVAANERGEAEKILTVKKAEAERESKRLNGEGIAAQRKAIVEGLRESVQQFKESVEGTTSQDVMSLVIMTQYFDTLKE